MQQPLLRIFYFLLLFAGVAAADGDISGRVFSDQGSTAIGAGITVSVSVNGGAIFGSDDTDVNGDYLIPSVTMSAGDVLTVFIDNETQNAVTVTVGDGNALAGLDLYQNYLIARYDDGGSLTNADIAIANGSGDSDISAIYTESGAQIVAAESLYVAGPYAPGSDLAISDNIFINGDFDTSGGTINVSGSWINSGGTHITGTTSTVNFTATSGAHTIDASDSFWDVNFNDGAGTATWQLAGNLSVSNDLTVTDGILDTENSNDYSITVGRDLTMVAGELRANNSIITVSRNATFDGTEDSTQFHGASVVLDGTGTLTYNNLTTPSNQGYFNLTTGQGGNTTTTNDQFAIVAGGQFSIGSGTLTGGSTLSLRSNVPMSFDPAANYTGSNLYLRAAGTYLPTLVNGYDVSLRVFDGSVTQTGNVTTTGRVEICRFNPGAVCSWDTDGFDLTVRNMTVGSGNDTALKTLDISNSNVDITGAISGESLRVFDVGGGTQQAIFTTTNSTVTFSSSAAQNVELSGSSLDTVIINNTAAAADVTFVDSATISEFLDIQDGQVVFGTEDLTIQDTSGSGTALTLAAGTTLTNNGTGNFTIGGDVANAGTISFDSSGGGAGDADDILIRSTVASTQRNWQGAGTFTMVDVDVQDQTVTGGTPSGIAVLDGTDSGNNINWDTGLALGDASGTVYSDRGITPSGAGITVSVSVNGGAVAGSDDTDVGGNYYITGVTVNPGDIVTYFINDEVQNGVTVTEQGAFGPPGLDIYQDHLIVRNDNGGATTNTNLALADDSGDTDITGIYSVNTGTLVTNNLYIQNTYGPDGNVDVNNVYLGGDFTTGVNTINVANTWEYVSGTLNATGSTVIFDGTVTGNSIIDGASTFNNVAFQLGGIRDIGITGPMDIDGDLTVDSVRYIYGGTTVAGDVSVSPLNIYTNATWTLTLDGSNNQTIDANGSGSSTLINLTINKSGGTATLNDSWEVAGNWLYTAGTFVNNAPTITFVGNLNYNVAAFNDSVTTFNDVVLNRPTRDFSITGTMDINGNLTIDDLRFVLGGMTVAGDVSAIATGVTVNSTWDLTLDGTGNQTMDANGAGSSSLVSLTINKPSGTLTINDSWSVGGNWTYTAGTVVNNAPSITFLPNNNWGVATVTDSVTAFNDVVINRPSRDLIISGNMNVDGNFTLTAVRFLNGSSSMLIAGNVDIDGNMSAGTTGLVLDGTGSQLFDLTGFTDGVEVPIEINKASGAVELQSDLTLGVAGDTLTVTSGILDLNSNNLTVTDTFTLGASGTLRLQGAETFTVPTLNAGSTVWYDGTSSVTIPASITTYQNLTIDEDGALDPTFSLPNAAITVGGNLNVTDGTLAFDDDQNLTVNGTTTVGAEGTLFNDGTADFILGGDLLNDGVIDFNSSGGSADHADDILLRSTVGGVQRNWQGTGSFYLTDVDYQDMTAIGGSPPAIYVASGFDSGNNINWLDGIIFEGILYQADRVTPVGVGRTISASLGGAPVSASSDTLADGSYSLAVPGAGVGATLALFIDDEVEDGLVVAVISATHNTTMDVFVDYLSVRAEYNNTFAMAGRLGAADDSGDSDLLAVYSHPNILAPQGLLINSTGTATVNYNNSSITVPSVTNLGRLSLSADMAVPGNWDGTGGDFTANTSTVAFTASSGTQSISENDAFYNLSFNDGGGTATWQLGQNLSVSNDLTISDGILETDDANDYSINAGRDLSMSGGQLQGNDSIVSIGRNLTLDGAEDSSMMNNASVIFTGAGDFDFTNRGGGGGVLNLSVGQGGVRNDVLEFLSLYGTLTVGSGELVISPRKIFLYDENPLSFDANSTVRGSLGALEFLRSGVQYVPELQNGYDVDIICSSGTPGNECVQTGNVTILNNNYLWIGDAASHEALWRTDGYDLDVGGDILVGVGGDTSLKTLNTSNSSVSVAGDLVVSPVGGGSSQATFVSTNSTITLDGSGTQNLTLSGASLAQVVVNNTAAANEVTFTDTVTITEALDIQDGQVVFGAADLVVQDTGASGTALTLAAGTSLTNNGTGNITLGGAVSNAGTIAFDSSGGGAGDVDDIQIRSTVGATQRNWQGAGTFMMVDVDVQDQTAIGGNPASVAVTNGTNSGNNVNWIFDNAALTGASVALDNTITGQSSNATVSFTTSNTIPSNGRIAVSFPAGFDISGVTGATSSDISGTFSISGVVGQTVIFARSGGALEAPGLSVTDFLISGLINPSAGLTATFGVETRDFAGTAIDIGTAAGVNIDPNTFNLSGVIRDVDGNRLSGVNVDGGALGGRTTNATGLFDFSAVTAGTNYSISFSDPGYAFSTEVGTLTADTVLNVTGLSAGLSVTGRVTMSNIDRTPMLGVTVTDGTTTTLTDANGDYSLVGVASGANIRAYQAGFSFEDPSTGADTGVAFDGEINFVGTPGLAVDGLSTSYTGWSTFLGMVPILELSNDQARAEIFNIRLVSAVGAELERIQVSLNAYEKRDIIITEILPTESQYGIVEVSTAASDYSGRVTQYRSNISGEVEFATSTELTLGMTGESYVAFNTYQPSLNPEDEGNIVANWLSILNLSSEIQAFQIRRYRSDGELVRDDVFYVAAMGRADLDAGHLQSEARQAGFVVVEPIDPTAKYISFLTRYGEESVEAFGVEYYYFATSLMAKQPSMQNLYVPISNLNFGQSWLEISNVSDALEEISLEVVAEDGSQRSIETFGLPGKTQRHFNAGILLDERSYGYIRLSTVSGRKVVVHTITYHADVTGRVGAVSSSVGEDVFGDTTNQSFNTFLDTGNWLKLSNVSNSFEDVVVNSPVGGTQTYRISPRVSILVPVFSTELDIASDSYGEVIVDSGSYGSILGEIVRTGGARATDDVPQFATVNRAQ